MAVQLLTRNYREKQMLTSPQEFPMQVVFKSKPSYNVVKEGNWGYRIHPPLKSRKYKELHSLYSLGLKNILGILHLKHKNNHRLIIGKLKQNSFRHFNKHM